MHGTDDGHITDYIGKRSNDDLTIRKWVIEI